MKKITLLFALLCIGALIGMEPEEEPMSSESSSSEQGSVGEYIKSLKRLYANNLDMVIDAIKADSRFSNILNDSVGHQTEFKSIVYQLQFGRSETITTIVQKIGTPAAKRYMDLGRQLVNAVKTDDVEIAQFALTKGADANFSSGSFSVPLGTFKKRNQGIFYDSTSPFTYAVIYGRPEMVKLLLPKVNPESIDYYKNKGYYPPEFETDFGFAGTEKDREEIWRLINQEMIKRYREQLEKGR